MNWSAIWTRKHSNTAKNPFGFRTIFVHLLSRSVTKYLHGLMDMYSMIAICLFPGILFDVRNIDHWYILFKNLTKCFLKGLSQESEIQGKHPINHSAGQPISEISIRQYTLPSLARLICFTRLQVLSWRKDFLFHKTRRFTATFTKTHQSSYPESVKSSPHSV